MWSCDCGKLKKDWVVEDLKLLCPVCGSSLKKVVRTVQIKISSFIELDEDLATTKRGLLLQTIKNFNKEGVFPNNKELSEATGIPINVVTPRVGELRDELKKIAEAGEKRDSRSRKVTMTWRCL